MTELREPTVPAHILHTNCRPYGTTRCSNAIYVCGRVGFEMTVCRFDLTRVAKLRTSSGGKNAEGAGTSSPEAPWSGLLRAISELAAGLKTQSVRFARDSGLALSAHEDGEAA